MEDPGYLKPCPFCGDCKPSMEAQGMTVYLVGCRCCGATGPLRFSMPAAAESWNKREGK